MSRCTCINSQINFISLQLKALKERREKKDTNSEAAKETTAAKEKEKEAQEQVKEKERKGKVRRRLVSPHLSSH